MGVTCLAVSPQARDTGRPKAGASWIVTGWGLWELAELSDCV